MCAAKPRPVPETRICPRMGWYDDYGPGRYDEEIDTMLSDWEDEYGDDGDSMDSRCGWGSSDDEGYVAHVRRKPWKRDERELRDAGDSPWHGADSEGEMYEDDERQDLDWENNYEPEAWKPPADEYEDSKGLRGWYCEAGRKRVCRSARSMITSLIRSCMDQTMAERVVFASGVMAMCLTYQGELVPACHYFRSTQTS